MESLGFRAAAVVVVSSNDSLPTTVDVCVAMTADVWIGIRQVVRWVVVWV